jgi:integrase
LTTWTFRVVPFPLEIQQSSMVRSFRNFQYFQPLRKFRPILSLVRLPLRHGGKVCISKGFEQFPNAFCLPHLTTELAIHARISKHQEMSEWTKVGENLVRYQGGTIYLRAKVHGKVIRVSLETSDLRIAKIKRDDRLSKLRAAASSKAANPKLRTIGDAIAILRERIVNQPHLEPPTVVFYRDMLDVLADTLPVVTLAKSWTAADASRWWKSIAGRFHAQRANNVLGMAKRMGKLMLELAARTDDPTAGLKRVAIPETVIVIPSRVEIEAIVKSIRDQRKAWSEASANLVEFLAFSGCRISQARAITWENVEADWLVFQSGVKGTKGAATRRLPINPPLMAVLARLRAATGQESPTGRIFQNSSPRWSLDNACDRLGIPRIRVHDLRHFFGSYAIESGVDIPTVAKWLGHKDGGRLLLKTYSHIRDKHSLDSAAKLGIPPVSKPPADG